MQSGIQLPQFGPAAAEPGIRAVARHAEQLGFSDLWVSDHLALPKTAPMTARPAEAFAKIFERVS